MLIGGDIARRILAVTVQDIAREMLLADIRLGNDVSCNSNARGRDFVGEMMIGAASKGILCRGKICCTD